MYRETYFFLLYINGKEKTIAVGVTRAVIIYFKKILGRYIHPDFDRSTIHSVQMNVELGSLTSRQPRKVPFALILTYHSS